MKESEEDLKALVERRRRIYNSQHTASSVDKIPEQAHFAVLVNESMSYDDGYGSHGQPSMSTMHYLSYIFFDSEEALEGWILENHQKKTFRVISVKQVEVKMKTSIQVIG